MRQDLQTPIHITFHFKIGTKAVKIRKLRKSEIRLDQKHDLMKFWFQIR